jgi:hypothetical protein
MSVIAAPDHKSENDPSRRVEALLQRLQGLNDADLERSLDALRAGGSGHDLWQARDLDTALRELLTESIRLIGADRGITQKFDAQGDLHIRARVRSFCAEAIFLASCPHISPSRRPLRPK